MARYLFSSHDGYGLGHARRNSLIAAEVVKVDPDAEVTLISGLSPDHWCFAAPEVRIVHVPPLLKGSDGSYRAEGLSFESALETRRRVVVDEVERLRPDVVVIDRHPYGVAGELRSGLRLAKSQGAALVLGLRDVLDEPEVVAAELAGDGWDGVVDHFDEALVYGSPLICDHEAEYGLPIRPIYCGFVTEFAPPMPVVPQMLVIAAGGGGDGEQVFRLGAMLLARQAGWNGVFAAGPYADAAALRALGLDSLDRVDMRRNVEGLASLFNEAGASLQMAGYNSTFEALGAGLRPILVPRRSPRREQAIRATRLAAMGLADVVDQGAPVAEVEWLLRQPRRLAHGALAATGLSLDGAARAAAHLMQLAGMRTRT